MPVSSLQSSEARVIAPEAEVFRETRAVLSRAGAVRSSTSMRDTVSLSTKNRPAPERLLADWVSRGASEATRHARAQLRDNILAIGAEVDDAEHVVLLNSLAVENLAHLDSLPALSEVRGNLIIESCPDLTAVPTTLKSVHALQLRNNPVLSFFPVEVVRQSELTLLGNPQLSDHLLRSHIVHCFRRGLKPDQLHIILPAENSAQLTKKLIVAAYAQELERLKGLVIDDDFDFSDYFSMASSPDDNSTLHFNEVMVESHESLINSAAYQRYTMNKIRTRLSSQNILPWFTRIQARHDGLPLPSLPKEILVNIQLMSVGLDKPRIKASDIPPALPSILADDPYKLA